MARRDRRTGELVEAPRHKCNEAPLILIGCRMAQCVRCRFVIDVIDLDVLCSTNDEIARMRAGLSMYDHRARLRLDRLQEIPA